MRQFRFPFLGAFLGLVSVAALAIPVQAGTIAGWDFSGIVSGTQAQAGANWFGASPMTPSTSDANATAGGLTRNWTLASGTCASYAWGGNNFLVGTAGDTAAEAIAGGNFATFVLTAKEGYELSLGGIDAYNVRHSGSGPTSGLWQYKLDNGSFADIGSTITWGSNTTSAGNAQSAIDLSGISALQGLSAGTTVTLRCVTWGATGATGTWYFNEPTNHTTAPDLVVTGTLSAVPEPSTIVMLTLGGLGVVSVLVRRRIASA
jgi:hypothetical protein